MKGRKTENPVDQLETDAPQHTFAEAALIGIDIELEEAVDDDQQKENQTEPHQHLNAVELQTAKNTTSPK